MLAYLGRLLNARRRPVRVRYLSKAGSEPAGREGWLLALDGQGATFSAGEHGGDVDCLPWGSIASIRIAAEAAGDVTAEPDGAAADRPAFFRGDRG